MATNHTLAAAVRCISKASWVTSRRNTSACELGQQLGTLRLPFFPSEDDETWDFGRVPLSTFVEVPYFQTKPDTVWKLWRNWARWEGTTETWGCNEAPMASLHPMENHETADTGWALVFLGSRCHGWWTRRMQIGNRPFFSRGFFSQQHLKKVAFSTQRGNQAWQWNIIHPICEELCIQMDYS